MDKLDERNTSHGQILASGALLAAAMLWGLTYPLTKLIENYPTFLIIVVRFSSAALALLLFSLGRLKRMNWDTLKCAFLLSFFLTAMLVFNILGIKYTTSVRASFFTSLSFLMVPLLNLILFRGRLSAIVAKSALLCLVGIFLLCYTPGNAGLEINLGDLLCAAAAACGSLHILLVERVSKKEHIDSLLFTTFLMGFIALWGGILGGVSGGLHGPEMPMTDLGIMIILGVGCSATAYTLQAHFEAVVPANRVGILFALEPASGCILSVLCLHEAMGITAWVGSAIIMASILYMEAAANRASVEKGE